MRTSTDTAERRFARHPRPWTGEEYALGVNVLVACCEQHTVYQRTNHNKSNRTKVKRRIKGSVRINSAAARLKRAERALVLAVDDEEADRICRDQLWPAYEALCRLPVSTVRDLVIKIRAALDELENGPSDYAPALIRTTSSALVMLVKSRRTRHKS